MTRRLTIDESTEDAAFLKAYVDDVEMLFGLAIETFGDKQANLLSPFFRKLFLEHAQKVQWRHQKLMNRLHVDNPSKPLDPSAAENVATRPINTVALKDAASDLAERYRDDRRVVCVAVRSDSIAIMVDYTKRPRFDPTVRVWQGWPVEYVDHGPMAVMGGDPDAS